MSASTEITKKIREELLQEMDHVTREAAQAGLRKIGSWHQIDMLLKYELGTIVNSVIEAKHLNETERNNELRKLVAYWNESGMSVERLYDMRNVAARFTREFIKAQMDEPMANGQQLSWGHFRELQKLDSKAQMRRLKQIRQNCWSTNELIQEIRGHDEAQVKRSGGRKPTLPRSPSAMLQKIFTTVQQTDNYLMAMSEPLGGVFMEMAPQDVSQRFVENLDNTLARIAEAQQHIFETAKKLEKVRTRAQAVLANQGEMRAMAAKKSTVLPLEETPPMLVKSPQRVIPTELRKPPRRSTVTK